LGATPDELHSQLLNAPDGGCAHDAIRELSKLAKDGDDSAQAMLIDYARSGRFDHILPSLPRSSRARCPAGPGYEEPARHPALNSPETRFKGLVARLDSKLAKSREENQDLAEPTNWLTPASPHDLEQITERWRLPAVYLDFVTCFSPLRVIIDSDIFVQKFLLFGAADLIKGRTAIRNRRL
jgi:hypothetical protein